MKRLLSLSVPLLTLMLVGCGEESDQLPVDGRDFDGVSYSKPTPYSGRVIDGYLRNARVWLDLDGDGQYSKGPLEIVLANGGTYTLANGEPTAMTAAGGRFDLDISEFDVPGALGKNLDPRDYPLYALALPGKTLEETRNGEVAVARAYLMSASPGVTNVTPLTTLARYRAVVGKSISPELGTVSPERYAELNGLNLLKDYVLASDDRAHAYARALARFMASQIPDDYNAFLAKDGREGKERFLSAESVRLLGISLVQNAAEVMQRVDAAASGGNYANVDPSALDLPVVPIELSNPVLLIGASIAAHSDRSSTLPARDLSPSAELMFDYSEAGQLLSVSSQGCMDPSLPELMRLVQVDGYMAALNTQWLPGASLSGLSHDFYEEGGVHERIVFDWSNKRAYFDTVTQCHKATHGVEPDSTELGGSAEIEWSWSDKSAVVESVSGRPDRTLSLIAQNSPAEAWEGSKISGYRIENGEATAERAVVFKNAKTGDTCVPAGTEDAPVVPEDAYVTRLFGVTIFEGENAYERAYEYDHRAYTNQNSEVFEELGVQRLLRYPVQNSAVATLERVDSADGAFRWHLSYPNLNQGDVTAETVNYVQQAELKRAGTVSTCGEPVQERAGVAFAQIIYVYKTLTDYLIEGLESEVSE
ncbi:hypothetical protein [Marinobacter sp. AL4B]|uniref:hypothetical protein n=1 Tax=Marinobacter sp. AL4B TaxID=2871173 RepID=UPI001CAA4519|nr:hypothetical protein [Marinobacter sp. AL4B]MBZ0334421.1 hypothetical protein [Marinobacter sp. AL4B]